MKRVGRGNFLVRVSIGSKFWLSGEYANENIFNLRVSIFNPLLGSFTRNGLNTARMVFNQIKADVWSFPPI
jgi:hypothetical protein